MFTVITAMSAYSTIFWVSLFMQVMQDLSPHGGCDQDHSTGRVRPVHQSHDWLDHAPHQQHTDSGRGSILSDCLQSSVGLSADWGELLVIRISRPALEHDIYGLDPQYCIREFLQAKLIEIRTDRLGAIHHILSSSGATCHRCSCDADFDQACRPARAGYHYYSSHILRR